MSKFRTPVDIGNRGLQHCGTRRINPLEGFSENSQEAGQVSFCYDKLRLAELSENNWGFACRRTVLRAIDTDTMALAPSMFAEGTTYFRGCIVSDEENNYWISRIANNLGNDPENSLTWEPYFGPLTAALYDTGTIYNTGEIVYTTPGDGTARVYVSLQSGNEDDPATATAWDATVTYQTNDVVTRSSVAYMSLIDLNQNNDPALAPALWDVTTTYAAAARVGGSDGVIYSSIGNGNVGNNPVSDGGINWTNTGVLNPWTTDFTGGTGSLKWRQIGGAEFPMGVGLTTLNIVYPVDAGPLSQTFSRNVYKLPAGFLRIASQWPGTGITSPLGGPTGLIYRDWAIENGFLTSAEAGPIILRFVADVTDVTQMDPMFCEGLAARIGMEVCEPLTQSTSKLGAITKIYGEWISRAKLKNAIEQGADEAPDDDWIAVRA